ncbi:MAG: hypothetical protein Q9188_000443 [Gyalolechia gomerana]
MAPRFPSIQSFFKPEAMDERHPVVVPAAAGDGFTSAEVEAVIHPALPAWKPREHYQDVQISKLVPGSAPIRLWYAKVDYELRLGQLVALWTFHISPTEYARHGSSMHQSASYATSIFPERDNSCYFMVQADKDIGMLFKKPLGYTNGKQLTGLMNLRNFVDGGHEIANGRVLVCVKSIGGRKKSKELVLCAELFHALLTHMV